MSESGHSAMDADTSLATSQPNKAIAKLRRLHQLRSPARARLLEACVIALEREANQSLDRRPLLTRYMVYGWSSLLKDIMLDDDIYPTEQANNHEVRLA